MLMSAGRPSDVDLLDDGSARLIDNVNIISERSKPTAFESSITFAYPFNAPPTVPASLVMA